MATKKTFTAQLVPVDELIESNNVPAWEAAGLKRFAGWAEGKAAAEEEFLAALEQFRSRSLGGGRR